MQERLNNIKLLFVAAGLLLISANVLVIVPRYKTVTAATTVRGVERPVIQLAQIQNVEPVKLVEIKQCRATWYGGYFHGRLTANGEVFDEMGMTAASNSLAMGTQIRVTNLDNGRSVTVRITDRGGFTHCLDLSKGAFMQLGDLDQGVLNVTYEIL